MIYLPDDKMFVNKFTLVTPPSKRQIFARTGQHSVSPSGMYTKDKAATFFKTPTQSAMEFLDSADSFVESSKDVTDENNG